ncbi:hypothetical protein [Levilactobacillus sp. N40-8-2]|uniref:hypothetical protein n=1 Tax=Levilactobacillus muriae TaxID=3238987 RepID=UPI0038B33AA9
MVVDQYMNFHEYQKIMDSEGLRNSMAVKLYLTKAAHFYNQQKALQQAVGSHPHNLALSAELRRVDESRVENVWLAIETAKAEKLQGWQYLEDGSDYVNTLLVKYEGQMDRCSRLESLKTEYIEILEEMQQRQIKNGA